MKESKVVLVDFDKSDVTTLNNLLCNGWYVISTVNQMVAVAAYGSSYSGKERVRGKALIFLERRIQCSTNITADR